MNKRKVLFIIDSLGCGGAEKSLISLLPVLDRSKYAISLLVVSRGGIFEKYVSEDIEIISVPERLGIYKFFTFICQIIFSVLLRFLPIVGIKRHGAELWWMVMHSTYPRLNPQFDVAVAYQQGFPTYYLLTKVYARKKYAWVNIDLCNAGYHENFNRKYYDKCDKVISVSEELYSLLVKQNFIQQNKLYVIYDIVNADAIKQMSAEQRDLFQDKRFRILTVGRLAKQKNYPLAVEAASILRDNGIRFHWYFIGEGCERKFIENLIRQYNLQNCVTLLGMYSNPYPYMVDCDIYVQTSLFEGYGLTIREARILNKPVVSTNFPVVYNQIHNGENGLIAEMNAESVAEKIILLIQDTTLREHIIKNTKQETETTIITESAKVNALLSE